MQSRINYMTLKSVFAGVAVVLFECGSVAAGHGYLAGRGNPLFIPEIRTEASNAAKVFYAVGHYHALGFSPFSIESVVYVDGVWRPGRRMNGGIQRVKLYTY